MKVLQVLAGGTWGGGCVVVLDYLSEMVRRGDEVWVVCLDDEVERRFAEAGCKTVRSPFWFHPINPLDAIPFFQLWRLCRREKFDLVATHTSKGGFLGRLAAKLAGAPHIVHHAHGFAFRETQKPWIQRCYILLERIAARACDRIISVSEDHRQGGLRARVAPPEKIVTVLNGIDVGAFDRPARPSARKPGEVVIGVASRFAPKKGIGDLIEAFPAIHAAHPGARLVLAGDGPSRVELQEQAGRTGLGDRIQFAGFCENVPDVMAAFDIVTQPSISEGLSISVLEGMAAGKPLVVCDIQGNREIITQGVNGMTVPPSDPPSLAAAINWLIDHPSEAQTLAARARADCKARFSRERMVKEILESYDGLVNAAASTGATECYQQS
jgi:glycosyltransferase involved in cell wall biosynthesis